MVIYVGSSMERTGCGCSLVSPMKRIVVVLMWKVLFDRTSCGFYVVSSA